MYPTYFYIRELEDKFSINKILKETNVPRASYHRLKSMDPTSVPNRENHNSQIIYKHHRLNVKPLWGNGETQNDIDQIHIFGQVFPKEHYVSYLNMMLRQIRNNRYRDENSIKGSEVNHIEGLIGFQLRFPMGLKGDGIPRVEDISACYRAALDKLELLEKDNGTVLKHFLKLTCFVIYFMNLDKYTRSRSDNVRKKIIDEDFIGSAKEIIMLQQWNWKGARNGLVMASVLQNGEKCLYFWDALKKSHSCFKDPDYAPNGLPSIRKDPDMWWFVENILIS